MWSYYGAKTNIVDSYPPPKNDRIIESFAGTARYSLKYFDREVLLVDKYEVITDIWKWLQQCSPSDVTGLPRLKFGQTFDQFNLTTVEKNFLSFVHGCGDQSPRNKPQKRKTIDRPNHVNYNLNRIASNLFKIKHWEILLGDYESIPNQVATWFIDPPYQYGGEVYIKSNKFIDFNRLGDWARNRQGQVIVCENTKATWMDFKPIRSQRGSNRTTTEAIWCNEPTAFDNEQLKIQL